MAVLKQKGRSTRLLASQYVDYQVDAPFEKLRQDSAVFGYLAGGTSGLGHLLDGRCGLGPRD